MRIDGNCFPYGEGKSEGKTDRRIARGSVGGEPVNNKGGSV